MTVGEKIKQLRRKNDVTQEKLAAYLNISYQAISKWENNSAMPDISLVVPLANFFGVTTDELFDIDGKESEAEIAAFREQNRNLWHKGNVRASLELCRNMTSKYPRNYECLEALADVLLHVAMHSPGFSREEQNSARKEGLEICERIMEDCTDDKIRTSVRSSLVSFYDKNGDMEKALATAKLAPTLYCSCEILSDLVWCDNDDIRERHCDIILMFTELLTGSIWNRNYETDEKQLLAYEAALKIWDIVIDDGNMLFYHTRKQFIYKMMAYIYAKRKDRDKTLECLRKSMFHAKASDEADKERAKYTGTFIDKAVYEPSDTTKNYTDTCVQTLQRDLSDSRFRDFLKGDSVYDDLCKMTS